MSIFVPDSTRSAQTPTEVVNKVVRRLILWSIICTISALPSFVLASNDFDRLAMVCGVGLFIAAYTATSCTTAFERFHDRPYVRRTLYIGYVTRLVVSVLFPFAWIVDMIPGMLSVGMVTGAPGRGVPLGSDRFIQTLEITIIQGTLLNIILTIYMSLVYSILWSVGRTRKDQPRGFEVVTNAPLPPIASPVEPLEKGS